MHNRDSEAATFTLFAELNRDHLLPKLVSGEMEVSNG